MVKLYTPMPLRYGVIHIDPVATVEPFPYPDILQAAREMVTKKYLVFVRKDVGLPWPNRPWYLFDIIPIAPCLPPEDGTMTPEMCVPIFPNTSHPSSRKYIHTQPQFPYNNCYHWSLAEKLTVRIRAKPEKFDDDHATKLEPRDLVALWDLVAPDLLAVEPEEDALSGDDSRSLQSDVTAPCSITPSLQEQQQDSPKEQQPHEVPAVSTKQDGESNRSGTEGRELDVEAAGSQAASIHSHSSIQSTHSANSEFRAIMRTGIFGDPNQDKEVFPLVDLWLELVDHLKQDDIPNPGDLYKEYDAVVSLVTEAKRRREQEERRETLKRPNDEMGSIGGDPQDEQVEVMESEQEERMSRDKRKRCRPKKTVRKLGAGAARILDRIKHALRLPYIPIWP